MSRQSSFLPWVEYTREKRNLRCPEKFSTLFNNRGAECIYQAAGKTGIGLLEAAGEVGKWSIGVDTDQGLRFAGQPFGGWILTSRVKRFSTVFHESGRYRVISREQKDRLLEEISSSLQNPRIRNGIEQVFEGLDSMARSLGD
jgi:hypothetical protein